MDADTARKRHLMRLPERVVVGDDLLGTVGDEIREVREAKRALVITGPNVGRMFGEVVGRSLRDAGLDHGILIVDSPTKDEARRAAERARGFDVIIGLGGGKPIDVAKYAAHLAGIWFASVPTSAAHDGIASPMASLKDSDAPYSEMMSPPRIVIADIRAISSSPPNLSRSGFGDLLAKVTATKDWRLAKVEVGEYYGEYAAHLALLSAQVVISNRKLIGRMEEDGIRVLVEALISAGVAAGIAGSSRPCSGSEHLISHALDIISQGKGLHGEKVGISTTIAAKLHGMNWRRILRALDDVGAPTSFGQLGIAREEVCRAIVMAPLIRPNRYTILHKVRPDHDQACSLVDELGVA
ncbi:MAG: sn-glycerol-1-phosphate dehydrogenase [Conexivisphaera sp.]